MNRLLGEMGISKDTQAGRKEFARRMEGRRHPEAREKYEEARQSWCVGSEEFRLGLKELGWDETELERRRKGDAGKVKLARRLRGETTMTLAWIARRLKMGAWAYAANLTYATTRKKIKS